LLVIAGTVSSAAGQREGRAAVDQNRWLAKNGTLAAGRDRAATRDGCADRVF
jgi:hypothetical protein